MASLVGTQIIGKIVPVDSGDVYPTHDDFYGLGGYTIITSGFNALTAATINAVPLPRQKVGQIIFDQVNNRHYQIRTTGRNLSAAYGMRGAWPYEFEGSLRSTNIIAKNQGNIIDSHVGAQITSTITINNEAFANSAILAGTKNWLFMDAGSQSYTPQIDSCVVVGGSANAIYGFCPYSILGGGSNNKLQASQWSILVGGRANLSYNSAYSFIGGGDGNRLGNNSYAASHYSLVLGGQNNNAVGMFNIIGGGSNNYINGSYNAILGGKNNQAAARGDIVVGGDTNKTFAVSDPGSVLYSKSYSDVRYEYARDTKHFFVGPYIYEFLPGATAQGVEAAGRINVYGYSTSYNDFLTGHSLLFTLSSNTPTVSGRFGHGVRFVRTNDTTSGEGLIVGEPGANKVHIYRFNRDTKSNTFVREQILNLSDVEASPPLSSQFGFSIEVMDQWRQSAKMGGSPYGLLTIGAPGLDSVYIYKCDKADPFSIPGSFTNFTYLQKITGDSGSEFGYDIRSYGTWSETTFDFLSAAAIAVGAPNDAGKGAVYFFLSFMDAGYSPTNKVFTPFTFQAKDNWLYEDGYNLWRLRPNSRYGESIHSFGFTLKDDGRFGITLAQKAKTNWFDLTSWYFPSYINAPNRDYVIAYLPDPVVSGRVANNTFHYDVSQPANTNTLWINVTALSGGTTHGRTTYLSGNDGVYVTNGYGDFTVLGQGNSQNTNFEGPNNSYTGVYSISSLLMATNWGWYNIDRWGNDIPTYNVYNYTARSKTRKYDNNINAFHPGYTSLQQPEGPNGYTSYFALYPTTNYNIIESYGFVSSRVPGSTLSPGFATFYYLSAGKLTYSHISLDVPGEVESASVMVGGRSNTIRGKDSVVLAGVSNTINTSNARSTIIGGNNNTIDDISNTGTSKQNSIIVGGNTNRVRGSDFGTILNGSANIVYQLCTHSTILNGSNNTINQNTTYSTIVNGRNNTINQNLSGVFIVGSNITATQSNTTYVNNLIASNHIQAATKSFSIKHPTKKGKKLTYGSLESPYHGVRLTGFDQTYNGICIVQLPDYISSLVKEEEINIQLTNYKHGNTLYVDNVDLSKNQFTVKASGILARAFTYDFYWSFTAIRKDVPEIEVEA